MKKFDQARVNGGSNYDSQPEREAIVGAGGLGGRIFQICARKSTRLGLLVHPVTRPAGDWGQHNLVRGNPLLQMRGERMGQSRGQSGPREVP